MKSIRIIIGLILPALLAITAFGQDQQPQPSETPAQNPPETVQTPSKPTGVIRIGIVLPKAQITQDGTVQDLSEAVRQNLTALMASPAVEIVPIDAKMPATVKIEAAEKGCDYILFSSLARKQKNSFFGNLIKIALPVVTSTVSSGNSQTQTGTTTDSGGGIKQTAQTAAQSMAGSVAATIKANDTLEFEYNLTNADVTSSKAKSLIKVKAKSNGEDVLTKLIEQASNAILEAALKS